MHTSWTSSFAGVVILAMTFGGSPSALADMWTNAAGHPIEAKLVGGDGRTVILERPTGTRISMPLLSLSPSARQTAAKQLEKLALSDRKISLPDPTGPVADHARLLHEAGLINAEELEATLDSLRPWIAKLESNRSDKRKFPLLEVKPNQ